ncbi:MAG: hypothetical protein K6G62_00860 [Eubacterium sp.]|nr:hypothetical protein [Eubacterium sp.]
MEDHVFYKTTIQGSVDNRFLLQMENCICDIQRDLEDNFFSEGMPLPIVILNDSLIRCKGGSLDRKKLTDEFKKLGEDLASKNSDQAIKGLLDLILSGLEEGQKEWPDFNRDLISYLAKQDRTLRETPEFAQIMELLRKRKISYFKIGEYIKEQNVVVVYYKAVERICQEENLQYEEMIRQTLARQMFMEAHYLTKGPNNPWRRDQIKELGKKERDQMAEAMSDLYAYLFLLDHFCMDMAEYQHEQWTKFYFSSWPYALGLNFMLQEGRIRGFKDVEEATACLRQLLNLDCQKAYGKLLEML